MKEVLRTNEKTLKSPVGLKEASLKELANFVSARPPAGDYFKLCKECKKEIKYSSKICSFKKFQKKSFCSRKCYKISNITKLNNTKIGNSNSHWKGGKSKHSKGYIWIHILNHPHLRKNRILEHRLVMEKHIGRCLKPKEVVHHINGNPSDNRIENLKLFKDDSNHKQYHYKTAEV